MTIQLHPNTDRELTQSMHPSPAAPNAQSRALNGPVVVLAWTMFLVPAVGVPSELMLQDTLKSAVVAFGVLGAALLFFWQQRHRTAPLQWHGLVWLPLVLMTYALGSMVWSHTYLAGVEAIRWFLLSLLLWLGLNTLTKENLPTLLWGIHVGVVVASVWTALQFWFDLRWFPQGAPPSSTFVNRNFFAEYAVSVLPLSVWLLATMRPSRMLLWMAGSLALNVTAILMTGTRSALVALLVLLPVLTLILIKYRAQWGINQWTRAHRWSVGLILVLGVAGLSVIPTGQPDIAVGTTPLGVGFARTASMTKGSEYTEGSFSIRSVMWKATARMVMAHPWTGVGAGAWEVQIPLYQPVDMGLETDYYAHNEFLQLLGEYGAVVGGLFLAVLFAYLLLAAGTTWRLQGADRNEAPLRSLVLLSLLALLIVSNAGFPWRLAGTGALFALCLALLAGMDARLQIRNTFFATPLPWRPERSRAALGVLGGFAALALVIFFQAAQAERLIVRAIHLGNAAARAQKLGQEPPQDLTTELLQSVRHGIAINPHYRKLTPIVADQLASRGDWRDAIWIWESIVVSRPYIAAIWSNLAKGYTQTGQYDSAFHALRQWQRLQPDAPGALALKITLLSITGQNALALQEITAAYDQKRFDAALLMSGYAFGLKTRNWPLAIRSLELRIAYWPEQSADGYFRLGKIYADPALHDDAKALTAFRRGWDAVPLEQKENYRNQVPQPYRAQM